jgi:hypothetical protein
MYKTFSLSYEDSYFFVIKFLNLTLKFNLTKQRLWLLQEIFSLLSIDMCQIMGTMATRLYANANYFSHLELSGSWHATTHLACWNGEQIVNESIWHYKYTLQMVSAY